MAINKVENTNDEKNFKFLTNQSSILLTSDTNNVTINGVNVIVDKPKVGDVMCVKGGQVVWVDGLSITPKQLSQEIEPVGICVSINGNKAIVRYRTEYTEMWAAGDRLEIPYFSYMNDKTPNRELKITLNGVEVDDRESSYFMYTPRTRYDFSYSFNEWLSTYHNTWSSELVKLDTDKPVYPYANITSDDLDIKVNDAYQNRVIVTAKYTNDTDTTSTIEFNGSGMNTIKVTEPVTANHISGINNYYKNNGFKAHYFGGCCLAKFYKYCSENGTIPSSEMKSIDSDFSDISPVRQNAFNGANCQILRKNFASYDEYIDSMMIKLPCGKGGVVTKFPSGKEDTYKLWDCTFGGGSGGSGSTLYPAAHKAATINVDAPGLGAGNWWLPSVAEMVQMMHDVTYGIDSNTNLDIVNIVLTKLNSFYGKDIWSMLSSSANRWTSSRFSNTTAYVYSGESGIITDNAFYNKHTVSPITIYEF